MNLEEEVNRAEAMLKNKVVSIIFPNRKQDFGIEFKDGTRLFVDKVQEGLEISITSQDETERTD